MPNKVKSLWGYFKPLFEGKDNKISLRSVGAFALLIDFIINTHNSSNVMIRVLKLISQDKALDAGVVAAMSANLGQIVLLLGLEAGLITALLALKTFQTGNVETKSLTVETQETKVVSGD